MRRAPLIATLVCAGIALAWDWNSEAPTLSGTATVYDDLVVSLTALKAPAGVTAPGWAAYASGPTALETYWFDAAADECLDFTMQIPHQAKVAADYYYCHVHWTPRVTSDGNPANQDVDWEMSYIIQDIGDAAPGVLTTDGHHNEQAVATIQANTHYLTELTPIAATGFGLSAIIVARICRDADDATNDTYEQDAGILSMDCHIEIDSLGSRTELAK